MHIETAKRSTDNPQRNSKDGVSFPRLEPRTSLKACTISDLAVLTGSWNNSFAALNRNGTDIRRGSGPRSNGEWYRARFEIPVNRRVSSEYLDDGQPCQCPMVSQVGGRKLEFVHVS